LQNVQYADTVRWNVDRTYPLAFRHQPPAAPVGVTTPEPVQLYCVVSTNIVKKGD
jgi:hypothetical protein